MGRIAAFIQSFSIKDILLLMAGIIIPILGSVVYRVIRTFRLVAKTRNAIKLQFPLSSELLGDPFLVPAILVFFKCADSIKARQGVALPGLPGLCDIEVEVGPGFEKIKGWFLAQVEGWSKEMTLNLQQIGVLTRSLGKGLQQGYRTRFLRSRSRRVPHRMGGAQSARWIRTNLLGILWRSAPGRGAGYQIRTAEEQKYLIVNLIRVFSQGNKLFSEMIDRGSDRNLRGGIALSFGLRQLLHEWTIAPSIESPKGQSTIEAMREGSFGCWVTLGAAAWVPYMSQYLINAMESDAHSIPELGTNDLPYIKPHASLGDGWPSFADFMAMLNKNAENRKLYVMIEHPFQDRVFWEYIHGDNPRYLAEKIITHIALKDLSRRKGLRLRVAWCREPLPSTGLLSVHGGADDVSLSTTFGDYDVIGRSAIGGYFLKLPSDSAINSLTATNTDWVPWEENDGARSLLGIRGKNAGFSLSIKLRRSIHARYVDYMRRELSIDSLMDSQDSVSSADLLRFNWFPSEPLDFLPCTRQDGISIKEPLTWLGTGLLDAFAHGSVLAAALLDYLEKSPDRRRDSAPLSLDLELSYRLLKIFIQDAYLAVEIPKILKIIDCLHGMISGFEAGAKLDSLKKVIEGNAELLKKHV